MHKATASALACRCRTVQPSPRPAPPSTVGCLSAAAPLPLRIARGAVALLRRAVELVLPVLLAAMVGLILVQVIGCYGFNHSIAGVDEAATFAQI